MVNCASYRNLSHNCDSEAIIALMEGSQRTEYELSDSENVNSTKHNRQIPQATLYCKFEQ